MSTEHYEEEYEQYYKRLPVAKRRRIDKQLETLTADSSETTPLKYQIISSQIPDPLKKKALDYYEHLVNSSEQQDNEYYQKWLNSVLKLPWDEKDPPCKTIDYSKFSLERLAFLDTVIYGQREIKRHFIHKAIHLLNKSNRQGLVLAIEGPPGCGKTTLIKDGFCRLLDRPFKMINLGGAKDSVYLNGGEPIYKNSAPGKIVQILTECGSFYPVIYFDELDKISNSEYGKELSDFLMHLIDPVANGQIYDHYLDVNLDVSKAIFIFSFNDRKKIDPILLDRLEVLTIEDYSVEDKITICQKFLIPKYAKLHSMELDSFEITTPVLEHVVKQTPNKGIRSLERSINHLIGNIDLYQLVGADTYRKLVDRHSPTVKYAPKPKKTTLTERPFKRSRDGRFLPSKGQKSTFQVDLSNLYLFLSKDTF